MSEAVVNAKSNLKSFSQQVVEVERKKGRNRPIDKNRQAHVMESKMNCTPISWMFNQLDTLLAATVGHVAAADADTVETQSKSYSIWPNRTFMTPCPQFR